MCVWVCVYIYIHIYTIRFIFSYAMCWSHGSIFCLKLLRSLYNSKEYSYMSFIYSK